MQTRWTNNAQVQDLDFDIYMNLGYTTTYQLTILSSTETMIDNIRG
jgi:hypothetical protein